MINVNNGNLKQKRYKFVIYDNLIDKLVIFRWKTIKPPLILKSSTNAKQPEHVQAD